MVAISSPKISTLNPIYTNADNDDEVPSNIPVCSMNIDNNDYGDAAAAADDADDDDDDNGDDDDVVDNSNDCAGATGNYLRNSK